MSIRAVAILVDNKGTTVGAILADENGMIKQFNTKELIKIHENGAMLDNTIITKDGVVRLKRGNLPRITVNTSPNAVVQNEQGKVKKLLSNEIIVIYHGTKEAKLIPSFNFKNNKNDYGSGFYTTPDHELAKEWAWSGYTFGDSGYCYKYNLNTAGLNVLDFTKLDSIHWLAELLSNRNVNFGEYKNAAERSEIIISKYKIDTSKYDIIIGYRADDSYFKYVTSFLAAFMSKAELDRDLRFGNLGIQVFVKSKRAFNRLIQIGDKEDAPIVYKEYYIKRNEIANRQYRELIKNSEIVRNRKAVSIFNYL